MQKMELWVIKPHGTYKAKIPKRREALNYESMSLFTAFSIKHLQILNIQNSTRGGRRIQNLNIN